MFNLLAHFKQLIRQKSPRNRGQGIVEYVLLLALVGIAVVAIVNVMEPAIADVFSRLVEKNVVAPPALAGYTPPPTNTPTATIDPDATATATLEPSLTPTETETPVASDTPTNTSEPTATDTATATPTATEIPCPYGPYAVPARVQMENFMCGGAGIAFSDLTSDGGPGSETYRTDVAAEGPDIQTTSDTGGGYNVGWTRDNEWVRFELTVTQSRLYDFAVRVASPNSDARLRITANGTTIAQTIPNTGGWQTWTDITFSGILLVNGANTVDFLFESGGANYNYFDVTAFVPTSTPTYTPTSTFTPTSTPTNTPAPVEIILDNEDGNVTIIGDWKNRKGLSGYYGSSYLHDNNRNKGLISVRYTPTIPEAGTYDVYMWWPADAGNANNVPVEIVHASGTATVTVDETQNGSQWMLLGAYTFNAGSSGIVTVRTGGTTSLVIADAIRFYKP